ncbi:MAG: DUF488 domain-containing protein [Rhodanobacter sp.]|nr:MAG: DUF488 domain-containing protein [Rhodanobacter sp.]TAM14248.1 MAG: DUF488 domain-containing protein [Rhodanobacter sp.]TAM34826.1 MAG: DUF488 domain-containing protein [Rhodanobacter sp.]
MSIAIKRVYEPAAKSDGYRVLIDRLWPRGLRKEAVPLDVWAKELAPSTELRKWFGHDPALWSGFQQRYVAELDQLKAQWQPIAERAASHPVTILFGAHDTEHNNAVVMKAYFEKWLHAQGKKP